MRKQMLGTMIALLAIVLMAGAQTPGTAAADLRASLQKVAVVPEDGGISIEMTAKGAVTPKVETLSSPARIVVDLPNTAVATPMGRIHVGNNGVNGVRIGTDASATTRVVVDVDQLCKYELVPGPGNKLTLKLYSAGTVAQTATTPAKPAVIATANLVTPTEQKAEASKAANDFVVVEPTYAPKAEVAAAEPSARVVSAASKFVERPEGNLLPVANAAMQGSGQSGQAGSSAPAIQPAVNLAAEQKSHPTTVNGPKYTGEPISVNLKDVDLKDFFRLIHEISGLNVVLDPDVKGNLTIVLDDVPWDQALDIVLKNNALSRQLDGKVPANGAMGTSPKKRRAPPGEQEAEALAVDKITVTRFLSYAHARDVASTLKKLISQRGEIVSDERTNAIIISDIPSVIPTIDRLIGQLDRKTQ